MSLFTLYIIFCLFVLTIAITASFVRDHYCTGSRLNNWTLAKWYIPPLIGLGLGGIYAYYSFKASLIPK